MEGFDCSGDNIKKTFYLTNKECGKWCGDMAKSLGEDGCCGYAKKGNDPSYCGWAKGKPTSY